MQLPLWLALSVVVAMNSPALAASELRDQPSSTAAVASDSQSATSKVWIDRYSEYEEFLRAATIERFQGTKVGITLPKRCFFTPGGLAASAICKNLQPEIVDGFFESYKSEIAAYRLDRLLDLNMVPPTVERRVNGNLQSAQLWVENVISVKDMENKKLEPNPADGAAWSRDFHRARLFHDLIGNIDANKGNVLFDRAWNRILVDHSRCFTTTTEWPFELTRIDRPFLERVKALDKETLRREIGDLLETGVLNSLMVRRDEIVKMFDRLVRQKGESAVFLP